MPKLYQLETPRLRLRQWRSSDYAKFASINTDPLVMEYFPDLLSDAESNKLAQEIESQIAEKGWGLWALELKEAQEYIGFVGLHPVDDLGFGECVEIGWRLSSDRWGNGLATEAADASLYFAFEQLQLNEVVSFTTIKNIRSRSVMERLGMINSHENFQHPRVAHKSDLCEHVLYKISRQVFNPSKKLKLPVCTVIESP